jgi:hypothetical protein
MKPFPFALYPFAKAPQVMERREVSTGGPPPPPDDNDDGNGNNRDDDDDSYYMQFLKDAIQKNYAVQAAAIYETHKAVLMHLQMAARSPKYAQALCRLTNMLGGKIREAFNTRALGQEVDMGKLLQSISQKSPFDFQPNGQSSIESDNQGRTEAHEMMEAVQELGLHPSVQRLYKWLAAGPGKVPMLEEGAWPDTQGRWLRSSQLQKHIFGQGLYPIFMLRRAMEDAMQANNLPMITPKMLNGFIERKLPKIAEEVKTSQRLLQQAWNASGDPRKFVPGQDSNRPPSMYAGDDRGRDPQSFAEAAHGVHSQTQLARKNLAPTAEWRFPIDLPRNIYAMLDASFNDEHDNWDHRGMTGSPSEAFFQPMPGNSFYEKQNMPITSGTYGNYAVGRIPGGGLTPANRNTDLARHGGPYMDPSEYIVPETTLSPEMRAMWAQTPSGDADSNNSNPFFSFGPQSDSNLYSGHKTQSRINREKAKKLLMLLYAGKVRGISSAFSEISGEDHPALKHLFHAESLAANPETRLAAWQEGKAYRQWGQGIRISGQPHTEHWEAMEDGLIPLVGNKQFLEKIGNPNLPVYSTPTPETAVSPKLSGTPEQQQRAVQEIKTGSSSLPPPIRQSPEQLRNSLLPATMVKAFPFARHLPQRQG